MRRISQVSVDQLMLLSHSMKNHKGLTAKTTFQAGNRFRMLPIASSEKLLSTLSGKNQLN